MSDTLTTSPLRRYGVASQSGRGLVACAATAWQGAGLFAAGPLPGRPSVGRLAAGVVAPEWIRLTDWPVTNYAEALAVALVYATRWLIEEFHKALKTGTKAEDLQLETAERLFAAIAIKSVVALRLLDLRERLRLAPDAPAEEAGLSELELTVLGQFLNRRLKTVRDVALAIGRLGGHLNRKRDGLPGWLTLLRGMTKLNDLVEGARIALKLKRFG